MSLLSVKNLSITYLSRRGEQQAVSQVSFEVEAGEVVSLVGESGSGKSSVALSVGRLLEYFPSRVEGEITFEGENIFEMSKSEIRNFRKHKVAYVFQEPAVSLNPVFRVKDQIEEVWQARDDKKVLKLLEEVQLQDPWRVAGAYPHELSGGMQQRVMLAMALAKKPKLLVADEPTTALDATVQKEILKVLLKLQREESLTLLFVTHDLNIAQAISDRILIMKDGHVVEEIRDMKNLSLKDPYSVKLFKSSLFKDEPKKRIEVD